MSKQVYSVCKDMGVLAYKDNLVLKHYQGKYLQKGLEVKHT
jgi:hypothetical protein